MKYPQTLFTVYSVCIRAELKKSFHAKNRCTAAAFDGDRTCYDIPHSQSRKQRSKLDAQIEAGLAPSLVPETVIKSP